MKYIPIILTFILFISACDTDTGPKVDRDVFTLGNDFNEISSHAEKKKKTPDMDMLLRVNLPSKPTRSEVINYINIIFTLSRNQRTYLDSDPQVGMLTKVGNKHLDLLLQASQPNVPWTRYGIEAIRHLSREKDKGFILSNLAINISLSKVVYAKGWCKEAENILSDIISSSSGYLPGETLKCLARSKNPEYYPALKNYMVKGWNSHTTYRIIKNLPNIDLSKALPEAWEASRNKKYQIGYLMRDTLALGYMPAFHFLFESIDDNNGVPSTIYNAVSLVKQFTYNTGNKEQIKRWYEINRDKIQFDTRLHKYVAVRLQE